MFIGNERFQTAIRNFDAANAADPNVIQVNGERFSTEVVYAQRMTEWLGKLYPDASESLQLAARAQHIRRWEIPRNHFPMDRAGYHRWRTTLYSFHADTAAKILKEIGYDDTVISRVRSLLKKERLKADPESQALEDVICLVFLENYFDDFAPKHDDHKIIGILKRTWAKMSPVGHAAALKLPFSTEAKSLIDRALAG